MERIIYGKGESRLPPLRVRRDVADLTALHKIQEEGPEHLQPPRLILRLTRESSRAVNALKVYTHCTIKLPHQGGKYPTFSLSPFAGFLKRQMAPELLELPRMTA